MYGSNRCPDHSLRAATRQPEFAQPQYSSDVFFRRHSDDYAILIYYDEYTTGTVGEYLLVHLLSVQHWSRGQQSSRIDLEAGHVVSRNVRVMY